MYVGDLITKIRNRTGQTRYSVDASGIPTEGIPQSLIVDALNEARAYIQAAIVSAGSFICDTYTDIDVVAGTQSYELEDNVHFGNKIRNVQYSVDGTERNFRDLPQMRDEDRRGYLVGSPIGYIRRNRLIELVGIPNLAGAVIRVFYPREWDDFSLRVGQITSRTTTAITIDNDSYLDNLGLANAPTQSICIVNNDGSVDDYDIEVTSYDSGTRVLTIPARTLVGDAGDFVVLGRFASSHTDHLPSPLVQQYIKVETQMRMFDQKVSVEAIRENGFLKKIYEAVLEGYEDELLDQTDIPVDDPTIL